MPVNRHTRLFVVFLVIVLILLLIGIVSFYIGHSQDAGLQASESGSNAQIEGYEIYAGEDRLYGLQDAGGNTIIDPVWQNLRFLTSRYLLATPSGEQFYADANSVGVLDVDGNIVAPFSYRSVQVLCTNYFLAQFTDSEEYILYREDFQPLTSVVWDACRWDETTVTLTKDGDSFTYTLDDESELFLRGMDLSRVVGGTEISVNANEALLSSLSAEDWIFVTDKIEQLLTLLLTGETANISEITDASHEEAILSVMAQETISGFDSTLFLSTSNAQDAFLSLTWQITANIRIGGQGQSRRTITMVMAQNTNEDWIVADLRIG